MAASWPFNLHDLFPISPPSFVQALVYINQMVPTALVSKSALAEL